METSLTEICENIATINAGSKLDVYRSAFKIFNDCLSNGVPSNFSLTAHAVKNIQSDLASREEALKTAASHLFLTLVQLSITLSAAVAHRPDSWTYPIKNFLSDTKSLVQFCFPLLGSKQQESQEESLSVVKSCTRQIREWGVPANEEAQTILTNLVEVRIMPRIEEMLGEPERHEVLAMEIWQQLIYSIGNYIPTTNHELINRLLKLVEFCFKSNRFEVQQCAYMSWSILIRTFSLHPTFLVKKLRLFNVPLLSCAVKQEHRYVVVDVERAKTWCQLIISLARNLEDHSSAVLSPFFFFCVGMDPKITQTEKFNDTFSSHFSSVFSSGELDAIQDISGVISATQDEVTTIQYALAHIENSGDFLSFLSRLASKQHLPKKAMSDPETLNEWRKQLAFQGIQTLAAILNIDVLQSSDQLGLYEELTEQLGQVATSSKYVSARNTWVVANHRLLLVLIGVCIQLCDLVHGDMIAECFRKVLQIVTLSQELIDRKKLLYPTLALAHTAVLSKHDIPTVVKIISSIHECMPEQLCVPDYASQLSVSLSSIQRDETIGARFFIHILLDPHLLTSDETLSESYFDLYQQLLYCRNIKGRNLTDYKHYLSSFDTCYDATNTWRGWKISAEALLEVIQATNQVNEGTRSCPDFSTCQYVLSFPVTQCTEAPNSSQLVRESADAWKGLSSHVLKLISELSPDEANRFAESVCQDVVTLPKSRFKSPSHLFFTTQLLDNLMDLITFQYSVVFSGQDEEASPLSPPITPNLKSVDTSDTPLGSITQSIQALSKLLLLSFTSEISHSPLDDLQTLKSVSVEDLANSQAVTNVLMIAIQVFSHLDHPLIIHNVLVHLSHPINLYFTLAYSENTGNSAPRDVDTFYHLVARLWDVIKTCILTHFDGNNGFGSSFLKALTPILLPLFSSWDQSILTSVCDFYSRTFSVSTEVFECPPTLLPILTSLQEREQIQAPTYSDSQNSVTKSRRSQAVRKLESRENPPASSANKRAKLSGSESPVHSEVFNTEVPQEIFGSSNDTTIDTTEMAAAPKAHLPHSEEDPLSLVESMVSLFDVNNTDFMTDTTDTPSRPVIMTPDLTSNSNTTRFTKPLFKFYSECKPSSKPSKSHKLGESKLTDSLLQAQGEKEKRPFFRLQLTPLKLDEIKSSPTHQHTVNRRLQFPTGDDQLTLDQLVEAETLSLSPPILNLELADAPPDSNHTEHPIDSVEDLLDGIPLDAILSPDELDEINFQDIPDQDDVIISDDTNSLISLTSTSTSQSITPPSSATGTNTEAHEQPDAILEVIESVKEPIAVNLCPMETDPADNEEDLGREVHNESTESHELNNSTLINITTPEANVVSSTSHPFITPTHSILKKQSIYSPSPNTKKVSFADPLEERHSIIISPRNRKLRTQKRGSSNNKPSNSPSTLTRSARISSTDPVFPMLHDCTDPVDILIPALTSQAISRGIAGLLKAKNIETIGDLAMLSEGVAESLPIQPPKLQTLRMAFTKYQATQLGNSLEIIRQSANPLLFPQDQGEPRGEDEGDGVEESMPSTEVVELQDVELISEIPTDNPIPLRESTPSLETSSTQTDPIPLLSQLSELTASLDDQLPTISQEELIQLHNSLCHLLPTIVDNFNQI